MMSDRPEVNDQEGDTPLGAGHANASVAGQYGPFAPLGEVLTEAREAKKLSQTDASNYLRYSVAQINALENNDFSALPQPMITRGFIRNYARYLNLDASPLLDSFKARVPESAPFAVRVKSDSYEVMDNKSGQSWLKYILGSILILLFLLAWMLYVEFLPKNLNQEPLLDNPSGSEAALGAMADAEPSLDDIITEVPASNESNQELDANAIEANALLQQADSTSLANTTNNSQLLTQPSAVTPNAITTNAGMSGGSEQSLSQNSATQPNTTATVASVSSSVANPNQPALTQANIAVKADAWVQVTDASGAVMLEKIVRAGTSEVIAGVKPLNVVIGNANATSLTYAGKSVDLLPHTTENNVARIKLE